MSERERVIVVGAGAAGLMASISAARSGARVLLLEGGAKPGSKILASGGSRCNLTHDQVLPVDYNGGSRRVVARLLRELDARAARAFFEGIHVPTKLEISGKIFPVSDSALTLRDALLKVASEAGVELRTHALVDSIAPDAGGWSLGMGGDERLSAPRIVLATGGLSYPSTGSRGAGLKWAERLGHTVVPTIPALAPLYSNDTLGHSLSGLTLDAELVLRQGEGGRELHRVSGSFLFTHQGYSGPAALNLSRHYTRARAEGPAWASASFFPGRGVEELDSELLALCETEPRKILENTLAGMLPRRLAEAVLARAGLSGSTRMAELRREDRRQVARFLAEWPLQLAGTAGYEKAEVTAGGVDLSEVDPSTMESRKHRGLHFCGEVLDVDGKLGGYNFQWAWSSGHVAGRGAAATGGTP